jgi:phosphatidylserine/phosphatidylglycerophosphate/cardiolipin synthase-like enzyme
MYHQSFFGRFARGAARAMGHPLAFVLAVLIIVGWALTGPFFGYSDTWQLVIKIMIIDGETILTRSFNFTKGAQEKNAENLLLIRDTPLAAQYTENWQAHRQHSQPVVGRGMRQ